MMKTLAPDVARKLYLAVPSEYSNKLLWLPDEARNMGIHIVAGKGAGKSRLMGRVIAFQDFLRGTPSVIIDPLGTTIDNFLDKTMNLPQALQERLWPRVLYVDMSGHNGYVIAFPFIIVWAMRACMRFPNGL